MSKKLKDYFPLLWKKDELLNVIMLSASLTTIFNHWTPKQQEEFLNFCTGVQGIKFLFIPLDIFLKNQHNKTIKSKLDAWLLFFASDSPEDILKLIEEYPEFQAMYEQAYEMCRNVEDIMGLFSKELQILDRNTVQYMIDEMQETIDTQKSQLNE